MRARKAVAVLVCLLAATCAWAVSFHDPDMTAWELLWYLGKNAAFEQRWWHGLGWPAICLGLPAFALTTLGAFALRRLVRGPLRKRRGAEADLPSDG